jgi:hypothetical protein
MKKFLLTGICLSALASIQSNASQREKKEKEETETMSAVDVFFSGQPIFPGFNCCGRRSCCDNKTAVACVCGPVCTCLGVAIGDIIGDALQHAKCMVMPSVALSTLNACVENGNLPEAGAIVGGLGGAAAALALYNCCAKEIRVVKKRNHDD